MDERVFHTVFDPFPDPALLEAGGGWLYSPSARALGLSDAELEQLAAQEDGASLWLAQRLFHIRVIPVETDRLFLLRQDAFLSAGAKSCGFCTKGGRRTALLTKPAQQIILFPGPGRRSVVL